MPMPKKNEPITVSAPNIEAIRVRLVGTAPLMMARFSQKAMLAMQDKMTGETKPGSKKVREKRNFEDDCEQAKHYMLLEDKEKVVGVPCSALRSALISACRLTGATMTRAKISLFVQAEGYDTVDQVPLMRLYGESRQTIAPVRNATGVFDLRARPLWDKWYLEPTISFDADQFSASDVLNLLRRAGLQIGLLEGRMDSRNSAGLGYGSFEVVDTATEKPF